jgi:hypothetical protein
MESLYPLITPGANEIAAQGEVHQQVRLLRHADVEVFEIRLPSLVSPISRDVE